jgi:hypothetical protein
MHRCYCAEYCLPAGGNDSDGRPFGVAFAKKHFLQSHQLRVQRERDARQREDAQAAQRTQDHELDVAGAQLFATTFLDDPQSTRGNQSRPNPASMPYINDGSVQVIVDGLRNIGLSSESNIEQQFHRLSLETPISDAHRLPSASNSGLSSESNIEQQFHRLSLETPISDAHRPPSASNSQIPTSSQPPNQTRSKDERNQHTKIALTQLDNIQADIYSSANALIGMPSVEKVTEAKQLVKTWHNILAAITRDVAVVRTKKNEVMKILRNLEARISELDIISPSDPVQYNTGKL